VISDHGVQTRRHPISNQTDDIEDEENMTTTLAGPSGTTSDEHGRRRRPRPTCPTGLFIGGAWRSADSTFAVLDPATGEQIAEMSDSGPTDAIAALDGRRCAGDMAARRARDRAELFTRAPGSAVAGRRVRRGDDAER
jgi:succinate-semialdehyde dehydrogenase/glutarate-semialdehyde dehydrogenase